MKHRVKGKKLNRESSHRRALFNNLITSLVVNGHIKTSEAKAKAIQGSIDKLITRAKQGGLHSRRTIEKVLHRR